MIRPHPLLAFAILLPLSACNGEVSSAGVCIMDGKVFAPGETFPDPDGCNTCECQSDGTIGCTEKGCVTGCEYQGQSYSAGETFPLGDCGDTCTCEASGEVSCTAIECGTSCTWNGMEYFYGQSFPAGDGCNTCACEGDGTVSCTEIACAACDPESEWWNHYVATDPAECAVIDYGCPMNTMGFENDCGCGCTQDPTCPQSFDCQPPAMCDVPALQAMCPYSTIAL